MREHTALQGCRMLAGERRRSQLGLGQRQLALPVRGDAAGDDKFGRRSGRGPIMIMIIAERRAMRWRAADGCGIGLGDADLRKVKAAVDASYVILSGIDQVNVLQNGSPDDVQKATREAMEAGKPGGGFIMQPVDFLEYGTPTANVEEYVRTALEYAWY